MVEAKPAGPGHMGAENDQETWTPSGFLEKNVRLRFLHVYSREANP